MKILRARLVLPPRMKPTAAADARQIAETVARELSRHGAAAPARLALRADGHGRPARHLEHDLVVQTGRAVGARRWEG